MLVLHDERCDAFSRNTRLQKEYFIIYMHYIICNIGALLFAYLFFSFRDVHIEYLFISKPPSEIGVLLALSARLAKQASDLLRTQALRCYFLPRLQHLADALVRYCFTVSISKYFSTKYYLETV